MAGTISFGGLASGLDTQKIVTQLVDARTAQLVTPIKRQIDTAVSKRSALSDISVGFKNLKNVAYVLKDASNAAWSNKAATSSDTNTVVTSGVNSVTAVNGTYAVTSITSLATAGRVLFAGVANKDTTTFGSGSPTITYKGAATTITIDSTNNTLEGIKGAINSANAGVTASIISDGSATPYRLVLNAADTGSDTSIAQTLSTDLTGLAVDTNTAGAAAAFMINSVSMTSNTNTVSTAIPGVTFTLANTNTTTTTTLTVKSDSAATVTNVKTFIDNYTALRSKLRSIILPDSNGALGPLARESQLQTAKSSMEEIMARKMNSLTGYQYSSLAQVGITLDSNGEMQVDSAKLTAALDQYPTDVRLLFQGSSSEEGIAKRMYTLMDTMVRAGGVFEGIDKNAQDSLSRLFALQKDRQKSVESYKTALTRKFNLLENTIARLKTQQNAVDSFAGVYSNNANRLL